ncbi:MAG: class D sortase, partial [Thermoanaerobaculia bacterium]
PPLAIVRIPALDLQVPLLEGTDDLVLNRGVGRIAGTALPGELGNIGIAGHRDGFFRGLKDIGEGDTIELETLTATDVYRIDGITIVTPQDVHVLEHQAVPTLTLVTCYPFYFVGKAPKRYIVSATLIESDSVATSATDAASP